MLLKHATSCLLQECEPDCHKMKERLIHIHTCALKWKNGCKKCIRVWTLIEYHCKACEADDCCVPKCKQIREAL